MAPVDEPAVVNGKAREPSGDGTQPAKPDLALEETAQRWAESQRIGRAQRHRRAVPIGTSPLLTQLRANALKLQAAHEQLSLAARGTISGDAYASEWFLDNYYLIRASIQQALQDLPENFYRQLPRLSKEADEEGGKTRVHALARELAKESSSRIDPDHIVLLVDAYQRTAPLTMGELWALPAMLRVVLVERLTAAIERLKQPGSHDSQSAVTDAAHEADSEQVANCVTGLRTINTHDWNKFFERLSLVERTLRSEACGDYPHMDFATRDRYRKAVEELAAGADKGEPSVAAAAVKLAADAPGESEARYRHVGYYLIDDGVAALRQEIGYRPTFAEKVRNWVFAHPATVYLGTVTVLSLSLLTFAVWHALTSGAGVIGVLLLLVVIFVPAVAIAVEVLNLLFSRLLPPRLLPKLDFSTGVPAAFRTVVAVPALMRNDAEADDLLEQLERHYLGNPDPELRFALLTDFYDAHEEHQAGDAEVVARASAGVEALNDRYGSERFHLFHRKRIWNETEGVWMGWERKRGKLMEFNRLLRGAADTSYDVVVGDPSGVENVKYVLTLDADTRLTPAAAHRLVGALAHPLNRVEFDADGNVTAGYSLLQPRTDILPEGANTSYFSRLFVGENGLDLYTLAVSDVYQDLFGAGIYVGKGLYDIDGFQRALAGKIPENTVLSHDLLEGIYGGVGLVSDVVLYEDYPPNYLAQVMRSQRWVRGDWQLLPWLAGALSRRASSGHGLGAMDAWKIFDNLRRSLLMPAITLMLMLGWTYLPGSPLVWTVMALIALGIPLLGSAVGALLQALASRRDVGEWRNTVPWGPVADSARRYLITLAFVPFEALLVLSSIGITLYRLFVSRRRMLEWRTARSVALSSSLTLVATTQRMALALLFAVLVLVWLIVFNPGVLLVAGPVLLLWLLAPLIAYGISRSLTFEPEPLNAEQQREVRTIARRTWLYFEQFVGPEDNWLPPDNVQLNEEQVTAHRTSPTNIGLLLLSTLSAYDLGYLGLVDLSLRFKQTLEVVGRMERYRGHLLNWYDTRSLEPLAPRYVSSVDSGNHVGSLLAIKEGCLELIDQQVEPPRRWNGLIDTMAVLSDVVREALGGSAPMITTLEALRSRVEASGSNPARWPELLDYLAGEGL